MKLLLSSVKPPARKQARACNLIPWYFCFYGVGLRPAAKVYTEWDIPPERERPELVASAADVRAALDKGEGRVQLLDARAAAQFTGVTQ